MYLSKLTNMKKIILYSFFIILVACSNQDNTPKYAHDNSHAAAHEDIYEVIETYKPIEFPHSLHPYSDIRNWGKIAMNEIESMYDGSIDYTLLDEYEFNEAINTLCAERYYEDYDDGYDIDHYYQYLLNEILDLINTHPSISNVINYGVNLCNSVNYEIDLDTNKYSFEIIIGDMVYNKMEILYSYEFGSDIIIDENSIDEDAIANYAKSSNRSIYYSLSAKNMKWPNNTIKYRFTDNVDQELKQDIITAIFDWIEATNGTIDFEEIKNSYWNQFTWSLNFNTHLKISKGNSETSAGSSSVGYKPWANMVISQSSVSTCTHELGHTIGLYHEMQRPDRDEHVYIDFSNIRLGHRHNFIKKWNWFVDYSTEMDFNSLMMYQPNAFSIDGYDVIHRVDGGSIEPSDEITDIDASHVIDMYN